MRGLAFGRLRELPLTAGFHLREGFVFQESRRAESLDQVLLEFGDLQIACDLNQQCAQVQIRLAAVKTAQAFD